MFKIDIPKTVSAVTKGVMKDFNVMDGVEFMNKYSVTKERYLKRVLKYGDPFMNAPLARIAKFFGWSR